MSRRNAVAGSALRASPSLAVGAAAQTTTHDDDLEPGEEGAGAEDPAGCSSPSIESVARSIVERPAAQMMQEAGLAMQRQVPPEKREAMGKAIEAEVKKYVDESYPLVRERAIKLAPSTIGAVLEEKFSEDELKQLLAWLESPVEQEIPAARPRAAQRLRAEGGRRIAAASSIPRCRRSTPGSASSSACRRRTRVRLHPARDTARRARPPERAAGRHDAARMASTAPGREQELAVAARADRRARRRAARAAEPPRRRRPDDRRAQARRGLAGVPPRARGRGDRRPEGAQRRPPADRQRGADLARDHVGLPGARDADAGRLPRPRRHLQRAGRARLLRLVDRPGAVRQRRRGVPRDQRRRRRLRRGAGRELERRRGHALARPVPDHAAHHRRRDQPATCATTCCAGSIRSTASTPSAPIRRRSRSATPGSATTCRTPSAAPVASNAEGARLAASTRASPASPASARPASSACTSWRRRSRTTPTTAPASPIVAHPGRASAAEGVRPRLHQPRRLGAEPAGRGARHAACR